jgi:hypothetical protein
MTRSGVLILVSVCMLQAQMNNVLETVPHSCRVDHVEEFLF